MTSGRRLLGPLAAVILAVVLLFAIFVSVRNTATQHAIVQVHGVVGSEKAAFFNDPDVQSQLRKNGLNVEVTTEGSREMALSGTTAGADFYFPAGEPAARELTKRLGLHSQTTPFYTPMIVASWLPIAQVLERNGMVHRNGQWYMLDMSALLDTIARGERWSELRGNSVYATNKSILVSSTDVRKSNSAAMYLALASYIYNGKNVVTSVDQATHIEPKVRGLFLRQGFQENSSAGPFDDYVTIGMGKAPLVMAYEQQFIEYLAEHSTDQRPAEMVLLYPQPTIFTKHTLVPTDDRGSRLAQVLQNDPRMRELEIRHGFRNSDTAAMRAFWKSTNIKVPETLIDVVDPPSFEVLEAMITDIDKAYANQ